jgi:hypothetical protein
MLDETAARALAGTELAPSARMGNSSNGACVGLRPEVDATPAASSRPSGSYRRYVPAALASGDQRASVPPRLRKTGSNATLLPSSFPPAPPLPEDMADTRPMPKRTREDFLSIYRLGAAIDGLAADATPWQVAGRCARALADALQARAIVIHHHDAVAREVRSIGVHGPNAGDLLGTITSVDDDYVVTAVLANKRPLMLRLDGALPRFVGDRHRLLGTTRSLAAVPVIRAGVCVGIIEIAGVADERRHGIADACELVAQRLLTAFEAFQQRRSEPPKRAKRPRPNRRTAGSSLRAHPLERAVEREGAAPTTFPKRAPTLLCRSRRS